MRMSTLCLVMTLLGLAACDSATTPGVDPGYPLILSENITGGCRIRLVTPAAGETIDLSGGKTYEFAWTNDGSDCETPYTLYLAGNPANAETNQNIVNWSLSVQVGQISRTGGYVNMSASDFANVTSTDGSYQWVIVGYYGSHPASQVFHVTK